MIFLQVLNAWVHSMICEDYRFPEGAFKQVDHTGRNFFPPEYTPLLALLLKYDAENPFTTEAKRNHATAELAAQYNRDILSGIDQSKETAPLLKQTFPFLPHVSGFGSPSLTGGGRFQFHLTLMLFEGGCRRKAAGGSRDKPQFSVQVEKFDAI